MDQRFSVPDFVSPADAAAYQAAQWNSFANTAAGPSQPYGQSRRNRSRSASHSRSPNRRSPFVDDVPPDYDFADDTPPEEVPEESYYDDVRGRSASKKKGKKSPHRHHIFNASPNPALPSLFPYPPPPGAGPPGPHHTPPPPPPPGHPATPPPPPPPSSGHHGAHPHPHPHGRHGGRGGWAGGWAGPNPNAMPWAWHGGPHGRGGRGHGGRGGRGGFGRSGHGPHEMPNIFGQGPLADIITAASRGAVPSDGFPCMEDLGKMLAEQFGFETGNDSKEKHRGATTGRDDDDDVDGVDFEPPVDVFDTPGAYLVHVSLPGAKKEDVSLTWDEKNGELKVQGVITRKVDDQVMGGMEVGERHVGLFRRIVRLGGEGKDKIDGDAIGAKMEDGVLAIRIGKAGKADYVEVKKVDIQ